MKLLKGLLILSLLVLVLVLILVFSAPLVYFTWLYSLTM